MEQKRNIFFHLSYWLYFCKLITCSLWSLNLQADLNNENKIQDYWTTEQCCDEIRTQSLIQESTWKYATC